VAWMNSYEVDEAAARFAEHRILGPATRTLADLRDVVDANSDGWPYWRKPANAAARLMALIEGDRSFDARYGDRDEVTDEQLVAAYRPLKAFRTRQGLDFPLHLPEPEPCHHCDTTTYTISAIGSANVGERLCSGCWATMELDPDPGEKRLRQPPPTLRVAA
jgi:hypothetical protein